MVRAWSRVTYRQVDYHPYVPRPRTSDTRERIQAAALELFAVKGMHNTSLREIAERTGITKPALYYHFTSREDLLRSLLQPLVDDIEARLAADEARPDRDPRTLLADWFDLSYEYRAVTGLVARELGQLADLDLTIRRVTGWRWRMVALLVGPDAGVVQQARAIVAIGGLADCTVMFGQVPVEELRAGALAGAYGALGLAPE